MNIYVHYQFLFTGVGKVRGSPLTLRVTSQKKMAMWSDTLPAVTPSPPGPSRALCFLLWITAATAAFWEGKQCHGLPRWLSGKESACRRRSCRRRRFDLWVRKNPWRRKWQSAQYSCLENPMDRGAWRATVHGVAKSRTRLSTHASCDIFPIF